MRAFVLFLALTGSCVFSVLPRQALAEENPFEPGRLGFANPAAVYCRELGYDVEIVKTDEGERCVCVLPNGERCNAWEFYRGEVWPEYSYCARQGYGTETRVRDTGSFTTRCAVCVGENGAELGTVDDLMNLEEAYIMGPGVPVTAEPADEFAVRNPVNRDLPSAFNWYDLGGCTSVKNQANCGSCWAFATVVPLECNILIRDSVEVDLSEQWLVSCTASGSSWS